MEFNEIAAKRRKKRKNSLVYAPFVHFRGNSLLPVFFFAICVFFVVNSFGLRLAALGWMRFFRKINGSAYP
jgi:hypothetical protein